MVKRHTFTIVSLVLALTYSSIICANAFYNKKVEEASQGETEEEVIESGTIATTNTSYEDDNIHIEVEEYREEDTSVYVADIVLTKPYLLKGAFAKNTYGRNMTGKTSEIASSVGAALAINGDSYGSRDNGYVIRDGLLYRSESAGNSEDLVIYKDGGFDIIDEEEITAEELLDRNAAQVFSLGPALVVDGEVTIDKTGGTAESRKVDARTAIGIIDDLHYIFAVSDGRTTDSEGLTLYQFASFLEELGIETAYCLDGGGASTMVLNGQVVNHPTTSGKEIKERSVSDIVYIGY